MYQQPACGAMFAPFDAGCSILEYERNGNLIPSTSGDMICQTWRSAPLPWFAPWILGGTKAR